MTTATQFPQEDQRPFDRAIDYALSLIPGTTANEIRPSLVAFCLDQQFKLYRIDDMGFARAQSIVQTFQCIADAVKLETAFWVNWNVLRVRTGVDPFTALPILDGVRETNPLLQHVINAVGFLALALYCSTRPETLILTEDEFRTVKQSPEDRRDTIRPAPDSEPQ